MLPQASSPTRWFSRKALLTALAFGAGALLIMASRLTIPLPGTQAVTDPREILVTLGSALTGPVGGFLIGLMAGLLEYTREIRFQSMFIHAVSGLIVGLSYKLLLINRPRVPFMAGWAALVLAFYYVLVIPLSVLVISLDRQVYSLMYGPGTSLSQAYLLLGKAALPEALFTILFTSLVMFGLSKRYRRPLW